VNRQDKARWARCATLADIGEVMCDWINGAVQQSPTYLGGPHGETIRHARILCAVNRQGTVTNGMNDNNEGCPNAQVDLFVTLGRLYKLERIAWAHGLTTVDMPRRLKRGMTGYFSDYVQASAVREMERARYVLIEDPVSGRFSRRSPLWVALREFAR